MALTGTGQNSNLAIPESDDRVADFEAAATSNRPNMALFHLIEIVRDLRARVDELEERVSEPAAKKAPSRKTTKKSTTSSSSKSSDSDDSDEE